MRRHRNRRVLLISLLIAVATMPAAGAQLDDLPPGSIILEGEVTAGWLLDGPGHEPDVELTQNVLKNELVIVLGPRDASSEYPVFGLGEVTFEQTVIHEAQLGDGSTRLDHSIATIHAALRLEGTWVGNYLDPSPIEAKMTMDFGVLDHRIVSGVGHDHLPPTIEISVTGTWTPATGVLEIAPASWGALRAEQVAVQPAPRADPTLVNAGLLVGSGPYGIDLEQISRIVGPCDQLPDSVWPTCSRILESDFFELDPGNFAEAVTGLSLSLSKWFPTLQNRQVVLVIARLADDVRQNPDDPELMGALVRFFNFNTRIIPG